MLILTRRPSEVLCIGDDIKVTVLGFDIHGEVRLGIDAPATVKVHRLEVYDRIQNEKKEQQNHG